MEDLFETGLAQRKATLGAEYVENNLAAADDFTRPFQEAMTAWCWGFGWGDDAIDVKTRSLMNLSMIGALGKMHEWELHLNGAINNGVTKDEIRAAIHVIAIYCGVPQGVECFRIAKRVLAERDMA
ncbi:4-carboxymuconolactone decarboxylase [Epibacterium sp. SM1969]|uniref:4-carboxymuconolactone decarboxylase n=1 Tax=Tritonibacter aquimaris TaxID=2663379 RepID=A0A844AMU8_9RHOB|nr:carboxymuconolactone decarboxylase family protein [Tritonibacter aquimaris]MQY43625.1 4-carboxymuconolactone decarboxylase [Tritonibacter aquimaris]